MDSTYNVSFGDHTETLGLVTTDKVDYYSFNLLGNQKLNSIVASCLADKIKNCVCEFDTILTVEAKAIGLAEHISSLFDIDRYVITRKTVKNYMVNPVSFKENTFISGDCNYVINGPDAEFLRDKKIIILDDVVSTGGTVSALLQIAKYAGAQCVLIACALTEGERRKSFNTIPLICCDHIPVCLK